MRLLWLLTFISALAFAGCREASTSDIKIVDRSLESLDLLAPGPYTSERLDYEVSGNGADKLSSFVRRTVDIRGRLYLPQGVKQAPLIVFLSGNHMTCGLPHEDPDQPRNDLNNLYTTLGTCPAGMIEVPSHLGYESSAQLLSSHGYAVISINANRGINGGQGPEADRALVYARGLLVLKHLEEFYKATLSPSFPTLQGGRDLRQRFDFSQIGLMGHSRGGEGMRYAYNLLVHSLQAADWQRRIPGAKVRGIFEIGPQDFGSSVESSLQKTEAIGVPWTVLIPGCDGDLVDYSGVLPFERMLGKDDGFPKSVLTVWGANHNFFNTEWQGSDARDCPAPQKPLWNWLAPPMAWTGGLLGVKGSEAQESVLKASLVAFFGAHLGAQKKPELAHVFDPQYAMPAGLANLAPMSREFAQGHTNLLGTSSDASSLNQFVSAQLSEIKRYWEAEAKRRGYASSEVALIPEPSLRPGRVLDSREGQVFEVRWPVARSLANLWTVDLNLALKQLCGVRPRPEPACQASSGAGIELALVLADGRETAPVLLGDYVKLSNWNDSFFRQMAVIPGAGSHLWVSYTSQPLLYQTARIELKDFGGFDPTALYRGISLRFPDAQARALVLSGLYLSPPPTH